MTGGRAGSGVRLTDAQRLAWLRLIRSENVGPATFRQLVNHFGSAGEALEALPELARRGGRSRIRVASVAEAEAELALAHRVGARFVALGEPDYPADLAAIDAPPPLLAVRGGSQVLIDPAVAIVGSRNASSAGRTMAERLARGVSAAGFTIVSGLARGIDGAAHAASLAGGTVAVLAGGLDHIYPPENEPLLAQILDAGGVAISEMPFGWAPRAHDFPRRNRLISGMSLAVVVVEAAARSGSLHTARFAAEQGREVLAVPGSPLDPRAEGCNLLLRDGATLIRHADDVLEAVLPLAGRRGDPKAIEEPPSPPQEAPAMVDDDARRRVIEALGPTPTPIDEIVRHVGLTASQVLIILLELELAGRTERHGGGRVSLLY
ncbi:DNA-processing protein DprA [Segnochrobactrum spirostomi]|uniref:DNA-protecting protein DprA n=1 Tax=Segnochrobactrum spirostomi TaxID=2608987 RepID=A0A6A7XY06_9HYPH|nr:DNA-processing protein DprA [Segnochrobactrum spirostomi]MQT11243.1 DNA-protecting protein DprA [Segnochrobactrum spirostomi]